MTKTTNYQLNQWDATDRVLREDFNSDNRKIDAAIKAVYGAIPYVKLLDVVTEVQAEQIDLDLSEIDCTKYWQFDLFASVSSTDTAYIYVRCNGFTEGYRLNTLDASALFYLPAVGGENPGYVKGTIFLDTAIAGEGLGGRWTKDNEFYTTFSAERYSIDTKLVTPATLHTLNLFGNGTPIPAGSRFVLYGIRK